MDFIEGILTMMWVRVFEQWRNQNSKWIILVAEDLSMLLIVSFLSFNLPDFVSE
jgi:hypothetical protein